MKNTKLARTIVKIGLLVDIQYPMRNIIWMMHSVVWVVVFSAIWLAVYSENDVLFGFTQRDIITYFVGLLMCEYLIESFVETDMNDRIREGTISYLMVKPISLMSYFFWDQIGFRISRILAYSVVFTVVYLFFDTPFSLPQQWWTLPILLGAIILGHAICFFMKFIIGCLSFWLEDTYRIIMLYWFITFIPRGWVAPMAFLPENVQGVFALLPWQYTLYFPLTIFLEQHSGADLIRGFLIASVWLIILYIGARFFLHISLKRYNAVGN